MSNGEFDLSPDTPWGRSITDEEFFEMVKTGRLAGPPLERFWRMNEFQGPTPAYLEIMVNKSDIEELVRKYGPA